MKKLTVLVIMALVMISCGIFIVFDAGAATEMLYVKAVEVGKLLYDEKDIVVSRERSAGCTDMGDVSTIIPSIHAFVGSGKLPGHTSTFVVEDRENGTVTNAKFQLGMIYYVLSDGAAYARKVIDEAELMYSSVDEYLAATAKLSYSGEAVEYNGDGTVTLRYK